MALIYLDNAATTRMKPPEVAQAVARSLGEFGGVGRGVHEASLDAGLTVYHVREAIADLLGASGAARVAFSLNVTESLNIVAAGLLHTGDHAVTTAASHNSVLRPLYRAQDERGVGLSVLPVASDASIDYDAFDALFESNTKLAMVTHASNLTGDVYDITRMARIAHAHGALLVVDAAQTAGAIDIHIQQQGIDILCFTGHKGLYGPQGTGGLCVADGIEIPPYNVGGTGVHSFDRLHPRTMPECLEAGTINAHGIAGLGAGVSFVTRRGPDAIHAQAQQLADAFEEAVRAIPAVRIVGGYGGIDRTGIVALNVGDVDSGVIADMLSHDYGICTRAGAHCAPLMHEALGTADQGAVRFSFGCFNTIDEVREAAEAVSLIAADIL